MLIQNPTSSSAELRCFRCGKRLMPKLEPGAAFTKIVFVDAGERRRNLCCKGCVRPGDRIV